MNKAIKEMKRLMKPNGVVKLLGGEEVISPKIEKSLQNKGEFQTERIAGKHRVGTSVKLAEEVNNEPTHAFLSYGYSFADSLSITPVATKMNSPILLNSDKKELHSQLKSYFKEKSSLEKVTIVGGEAVVGKEIEAWLNQTGIEVERVEGNSRYSTSLEIAKRYFDKSSSISLANGNVFADTLSGVTLAYQKNSPIILTEKEHIPLSTLKWIRKNERKDIFLFGGEVVIDNSIISSLKK
jgi:putative cell wall-binding protein